MAFKTKTKGAGQFFTTGTAKNYTGSVAVLVEPLEFRPDQPNGSFAGTRDIVIADLTIFENIQALNGEVEPTILHRAQVAGRGLTSDLEGEEGNQLAYGIQIRPSTKAGYQPFACWKELDQAIAQKVEDYYIRREAEVREAMTADLPDFLDDEQE